MRKARWALLAAVIGLVGCVGDASTVCVDGIVCPASRVCLPAGGGCADPGQLTACEGKASGESCELAGIGAGQCRSGLCVVVGCGDGVVDGVEVCDDGNTDSGDGCRGDCAKAERCGDAEVDAGEACDDGPAGLANPADGCDACVATTWLAEAVSGGDASGTAVDLFNPRDIAIDPSGNVYILEPARVRRLDAATGAVTTVAGTGVVGYAGDGGPAISARLNPSSIAVDGLGNLFIAEGNIYYEGGSNYRVRRVDAATGTISTVVGSGVFGNSGDGGPATSARVGQPTGVAVDGLGNLFVADQLYNVIRRVDAETGIITTVAGGGTGTYPDDGLPATSARLHYPKKLLVDPAGDLYIIDWYYGRIRHVAAATGIMTTMAGLGTILGYSGDGGPAPDAELGRPRGIALDALGNLYIADTDNHRVRRVDRSTGIITTVAGTGGYGFAGDGGPASSAELAAPAGIAVDAAGGLVIADGANHRIRRVDVDGIITTVAGTGNPGYSGDGGSATVVPLNVGSVAVDALGNTYLTDAARVRRVDAATGIITTVAGTGTIGFSGDGGPATSAQLGNFLSVRPDRQGNLCVVDFQGKRIRWVDAATGIITTVAGNGSFGFSGDGGPATSAEFRYPSDCAVDGQGNLYVADGANDRIRRVDAATGIITSFAEVFLLSGVAVDSRGDVYVTATSSGRILRFDAATGVSTAIAGTGTVGFSGDGGPAVNAELSAYPRLIIDRADNLWILDGPARVRRVDATSGIITSVISGSGEGSAGDAGPVAGALLAARDLAVDGDGHVYLAEADRVRRAAVGVGGDGRIFTIAGQISPESMGPSPLAHFVDPRALAVTADSTFVAGGRTGTVQRARDEELRVVAGRYPQSTPTGDLARFRDASFGVVGGVAYDAAGGRLYLSESSANRVHVVAVGDPADEHTWTIASLAGDASASAAAGFADGDAASARFSNPTGLFLDGGLLYVADTGNHVIRAIDLSTGLVSTAFGTPRTRGFFGDGGPAVEALLFGPHALTRCASGDFYVADTGNHRVRRIEDGSGVITTVLGDGVAASSGQGAPARTFPVDTPLGLDCDGLGNLFVSSSSAVRLLPADADGIVDGDGEVQSIYGAPPRDTFPASSTSCLTGVAVIDAETTWVTDACTGILVELWRQPRP